jgi:hypothetical protein
MIFKNLKRMYDFLHYLHINSSYYTKNEHFPMHILFTTFYLLQKQKLNYRTYYKQKINTRNFVPATEYDMNLHAKIQCLKMHRFL